MTNTFHSQQEQEAAIARANEILLSVGLPLYGDVSEALARIVSAVNPPRGDNRHREGSTMLLDALDAIEGARTLYAMPPSASDDEPPFRQVNSAFRKLVYGGGVGLIDISEADSKAAAYLTIARNLTMLGEVLDGVAHNEKLRDAELREHRAAVSGMAVAFDLIERERAERQRIERTQRQWAALEPVAGA